jgi:predicted DNA-binding transcriptional regulator YafY
VWLAEAVVPWARERPVWGFVREEPAEGGAVYHFRLRHWREAIPWVLRWGASARVLSPPEAVAGVREEIAALARVYDS